MLFQDYVSKGFRRILLKNLNVKIYQLIFKWLEAQFPQVRTTGGFGTAPSRAPRPDQGPQGGGGGGARGNAWFGGRGNRLGD